MDERLFTHLASWLAHEAVVLVAIIDTRGATPRRRGARMLVTASGSALSIGGGLAEARVIESARALLLSDGRERIVDIDLGGGADAAGICGGRMRLVLRRWQGEVDRQRATSIAASLAAGERVALSERDIGIALPDEFATPDSRLLIVGAGHCGEALYRLARQIGFDVRIHDSRGECFADGRYDAAHVLCGDVSRLSEALETARPILAVLLNRDFQADVAALDLLCRHELAFLGMMGSRRRIATVRRALPQFETELKQLIAPVGIDIDAQTPEEIAISILAQLIAARAARSADASGA
ncbi:MAG: XdhC family protein [Xanthomonadales bacterium]|nr:XdhC family protein [Xanthomonadales bacterium]